MKVPDAPEKMADGHVGKGATPGPDRCLQPEVAGFVNPNLNILAFLPALPRESGYRERSDRDDHHFTRVAVLGQEGEARKTVQD